MHFNTFAKRADTDQVALIRTALSESALYSYANMIRYDPTLVDQTSDFFVTCICTNVNVYFYNYFKLVELSMNIHGGK